MNEKVQHVLRAPNNDRQHHCHWPGCTTQVKPALFACKRHWFTWPQDIRDAIWRTYKVGQEQTKTPSGAYLEAARRAQDWANNYEANKRRSGLDPDQGVLL